MLLQQVGILVELVIECKEHSYLKGLSCGGRDLDPQSSAAGLSEMGYILEASHEYSPPQKPSVFHESALSK